MNLNDTLSSTRYWLLKKSEPVFDNYKKIITNFSELSPKTPDPYNLNGREINVSAPANDGIFTLLKMEQSEIDCYYNQFIKYCNDIGIIPIPTPKYKWEYKSQACNSYNKFRIDIYKAGRIVSKCSLPKYGWAAIWIYCSMNKGDFINPYLLDIDKPEEPREYYFEIDLFESFRNNCMQKDSFSGHYGTQLNRELKTGAILKSYDDNMHYCEVVWDGLGNWSWFLDSICVHNAFIPQPIEKIYPYLLITLGVNEPIVEECNLVIWNIEYIKISDNIIML